MHKVLQKRKEQQKQLVELAKSYAQALNKQLGGPVTAILTGSVARGDFNLHSDIDVLVVSAKLPADPLERSKLLYSVAPPRVEPKGFSPEEFQAFKSKNNPLITDALSYGIPLNED